MSWVVIPLSRAAGSFRGPGAQWGRPRSGATGCRRCTVVSLCVRVEESKCRGTEGRAASGHPFHSGVRERRAPSTSAVVRARATVAVSQQCPGLPGVGP